MSEKLRVPEYVEKIRRECSSIDEAVERILEENNITQPPINVMKIASSMGISLFEANFKDPNVVGIIVDAKEKIKPYNCQRFIATDVNSYPTRRLFTIAHEIGHFVMHCSRENDYFERDHYDDELNDFRDEVEKTADKFAASLLLPAEMFKQFVLKSSAYEHGNKEQLIKDIQKKFLVSYKTAALRLQETNLDW